MFSDGSASTTGQTTLEQFVFKLKLDEDKQVPTAERIFTSATNAATPYGEEMKLQRHRLLDADLAGKDADAKQALEAYTEAARKMVGIEAAFMARIYTDLKPDQRKKTAEAFNLLAGIFLAPPQRGAGPGGER